MGLKEKILVAFSILLLGLGSLFIISAFNFGKARIIACDVGQGDAGLIITANGSQILIDGGPGKKVLECLSHKMPFWDREVEMIILTHPQKDHMEGFISVFDNYRVKNVIWTGVRGEGALFGEWESRIKAEGAKVHLAHLGEKLVIDDVSFDVLWPSREKLAEWKLDPPADLNDSSVVMRANFKVGNNSYCAYYTGDIPKEILEGLISKPCQILKISHHGSKTGTNEDILAAAKPKVAIIQVGKNSYGHPTREVLGLLESREIDTLRNDINGLIEIAINGQKLNIAKSN